MLCGIAVKQAREDDLLHLGRIIRANLLAKDRGNDWHHVRFEFDNGSVCLGGKEEMTVLHRVAAHPLELREIFLGE